MCSTGHATRSATWLGVGVGVGSGSGLGVGLGLGVGVGLGLGLGLDGVLDVPLHHVSLGLVRVRVGVKSILGEGQVIIRGPGLVRDRVGVSIYLG